MSETERKKGKVKNTKLSPIEWMEKNQITQQDLDERGNDNLGQYLYEADRGAVVGGEVWEILDVFSVDTTDHESYEHHTDGLVMFDVTYYNGGCSYIELITDHLNAMQDKEEENK